MEILIHSPGPLALVEAHRSAVQVVCYRSHVVGAMMVYVIIGAARVEGWSC